jgi:hypothetical protein
MRTMSVRVAGNGEGHGGEVFSCVHTLDSAFVLSAGWDGALRLWTTSNGQQVSVLPAAPKPLSCCALSPDGTTWVSASMDGMLSWWDAMTHQIKMGFVAHIRPISAIQYSPDGQSLATASWDRKILVRKIGKERDGLALANHHDIVAGCRWTPDSKQLLSWSHDSTLRLWETESGRELACLQGHDDRVTAACVSLDGQWAVSGSRDGAVKLWDLQQRCEVRSIQQNTEIRGCYSLLDGESVVTVNAEGWALLLSLPDFEVQGELDSGIKVMCGDLAPSGGQIALGSEDGFVHILGIDGLEDLPVLVTPTQTFRPKPTMLSRFLGKPKLERTYQYTCPVCRHTTEMTSLPDYTVACTACKRQIRLLGEARQLQPQRGGV